MATLERGCDDGEYHVYLNTNTSHAQPDYTFYHRLVHAPTGQAVCVTHLSNGTVTMYIPSEDLAYELGQLPWLNEPAPGKPDSDRPKQPNRPNDALCHIRRSVSGGGNVIYHIFLDDSMVDGMGDTPDYVVLDRSLAPYVGRPAYVTRDANGQVILDIPSAEVAFNLGSLIWLNEPKPAQPEPVKPPLGCMPEKLWLENRIMDLAQAIHLQLGPGYERDWKLLADRAEQLTRHAEWLGHWHP